VGHGPETGAVTCRRLQPLSNVSDSGHDKGQEPEKRKEDRPEQNAGPGTPRDHHQNHHRYAVTGVHPSATAHSSKYTITIYRLLGSNS
jgi:hypothetical protein